MRYEDDVYMPPTKINIKTNSNNESGRLVIKGKSRDTENKPQPVHVPHIFLNIKFTRNKSSFEGSSISLFSFNSLY